MPLIDRSFAILDMRSEICLDLFEKAAREGGVSDFLIDRVDRMMEKLD